MSFEQETGRDRYAAQLRKELAELVDPATGRLGAEFSRRVPCPLCQGAEDEAIFTKNGYTFVRCLSCGLIFANPQVLPSVAERTYRNEASSTELWMRVLTNEKETAWRDIYYRGILASVERFTARGRLLDVGCAVGHFLALAREAGWETLGLELSETAIRHAREVARLEVIRATLEEADLEQDSFDAASLLGVVEHVPDPVGLLSQTVRVVRPGGVVAVVVPNVYGLVNMFLWEKAATFDGRNHLVYFSMETLRRAFREAGLDVVHGQTLLTGSHNLVKTIQFIDPYAPDARTQFIPEGVHSLLVPENGTSVLDRFILDYGLGLRLLVVGRKP